MRFALLLTMGCRSETPPDAASRGERAAESRKTRTDNLPAETARSGEPSREAGSVASKAPPVRKDGTIYGEAELMGTRISINVFVAPGQDAAAAGAAMQAALEEMARIEDRMSEWREDSELSRINAMAGGPPQPVSPELREVLRRSRTISEATGGAFDVTFHGVGQLWSFRPGARPPTREAIAAHLPLVDWRQIEIDDAQGTVRLAKPGMKAGLGAIAKGYAVDRASALLRARGFVDHVVEGGGDTYVSGRKGDRPWRVGIQDPGREGALGALEAQDEAVVTSGGYQRYFDFEGQRYAHILDPRTGWPVAADRSPQSVTVVARDTTDADAYCTAIAVMGEEEGFRFAAAHPGLEAVLVLRDGTVRVTDGLRPRVHWSEGTTLRD